MNKNNTYTVIQYLKFQPIQEQKQALKEIRIKIDLLTYQVVANLIIMLDSVKENKKLNYIHLSISVFSEKY